MTACPETLLPRPYCGAYSASDAHVSKVRSVPVHESIRHAVRRSEFP